MKQPVAATVYIESSSSDSEGLRPLKRQKRSTDDVHEKLVAIEGLLTSMKGSVDSLKHRHDRLSAMFTCIICKDVLINKEPLVPQCCAGVVTCKQCLLGWLSRSDTCPHCRESISMEGCLPFPQFRPFVAYLNETDPTPVDILFC